MARTDSSQLWSAAELARHANVATPRVMKAIKRGQLTPDETALAGRLFLFRPARLEEITLALAPKGRVS